MLVISSYKLNYRLLFIGLLYFFWSTINNKIKFEEENKKEIRLIE